MPVVRDIVAMAIPGLLVLVVTLFTAEFGYRIGRRLKAGADDAMRTEINTIQAGTLSLLALLLGFSFSIGANAYEDRRRVITNEAAAIAKAYDRAALLPEPPAAEIRTLLFEYTDTRLDLFYQGVLGEPQVEEKLGKSARLQEAIWARARAVGQRDPRSIPVGLALDAMSELAELNAHRSMAMTQTVPFAVVVSLAVTAAVAMGWVGVGIGLGPRRNLAMSLILSVLFALIVAFIIDMDQPRNGFIRSSQEPLRELYESLKARR
jgi:hypothetical protein